MDPICCGSHKEFKTTEDRENSHSPKINCTSNVNIADLDEETNVKLKGDAIGDTLYSQSFVLKTLLQFSDLNWSDQVEEDLCFLWDMTVEKEVCQYLFELSYPSLACSAVMKYKENRFIEIVIGILANILCSDCDKAMADEQIEIIMQELDSDDPLILIQVMRLISAVAHMSSVLPFITIGKMNKIKFILCNSVNKDLLMKTLETVAKITIDYKVDNSLVDLKLYDVTLTCYCTLMDTTNDFVLETKDNIITCKYMLEIVSNICSYVDNFDNCELLLQLQRNSEMFVNKVIKILDYFCQDENLFPVTEEFIFFVSVFRYTLIILNVSYVSKLFILLLKILDGIIDMKNEVSELFESILELICFLLSRGNMQCVKKDLRLFPKNKVKSILNIVNEHQHKYEYNLNMQELLSLCK